MYEEYLRDPNSVGQEWRELFENGKLAELPVIPTERSEVRDEGRGRGTGQPYHVLPLPRPPSPLPPVRHRLQAPQPG